ncbi:hypothetical protein [Chelativorans alearense]|uniref:hypothetical protein n=1 Tax=Chelativorans alearense TaxID=2681495 RepID=UPI0031B59986
MGRRILCRRSERDARCTEGRRNAQLGFPISGYLELHIKQGPALEREGIPIGIVHGIQGTRWLEVVLRGQAAHADTTALAFRRDPMVAATVALDRLYESTIPEDEHARFTVGRFGLEPGSINAIPETVTGADRGLPL